MTRVLAINGSYRDDGITDQMGAVLVQTARDAGAEVEVIFLRDYPIEFCLNCRECTQKPGEVPGECVQHDCMHELVGKIEQADAFILASPTNFGSVTAVFKRFMERLIVYAYWPWGMPAPEFRKAHARRKKALLVSSCAAPGIMGRLLYTTNRQLKMTAKTIGADVTGSLVTGLVAGESRKVLPKKANRAARRLVTRLL